MADQIVQLVTALRMIGRPDGATLRQLESELMISERTAYRLLGKLQESGYPLYDDQNGHEKIWHMNWGDGRGWSMPVPNTSLNQEEQQPYRNGALLVRLVPVSTQEVAIPWRLRRGVLGFERADNPVQSERFVQDLSAGRGRAYGRPAEDDRQPSYLHGHLQGAVPDGDENLCDLPAVLFHGIGRLVRVLRDRQQGTGAADHAGAGADPCAWR